MIDTRMTAATIAVIILETRPRIITSNAINKRYGIALLTPTIPFSIGVLNQRKRSPATNTAIVILIGSTKAPFTRSQVITWLTNTESVPIINKNTTKLRSISFVNGRIITNNNLIIIHIIILISYYL